MMSPPQTLHAFAGSPALDGVESHDGTCRLCSGTTSRAMLFDRWQGANFTSQDRVTDWSSDYICEACAWCCSWVAPPDRAANATDARSATGAKAKGLNLRLFSHLWSDRDGYRSHNKAEKPAILAWLRSRRPGETWWAAIADTGQKHVISFARMQGDPRGTVRFEEADVPMGSWALVDAITALLTAGATKTEIESGVYTARAYQLARDAVIAFECEWSRERGGGWFGLALWLSQRDESAVDERRAAEKAAKEADRERGKQRARVGRGRSRHDAGRGAGNESPVPRERSECTDPLGPNHSASEGGVADDRDRVRVDERGHADAAPGSAEQLSFFGDRDAGGGGRRARKVAAVGGADRARARAADG